MGRYIQGVAALVTFLQALGATNAQVQNVAGIKVLEFHQEMDRNFDHTKSPFQCSGVIDASAGLQEIELSPGDLKAGVDCLAADFDGNGILDFAFWGKLSEKGRKYKVVLFDKKGIKKSELLSRFESSFIRLYPPTKKSSSCGEPTTKRYGLIQDGEGTISYVYLYSAKTNRFELFEFPDEGCKGDS